MSKLPIVSGQKLIKILGKIGYHEVRQRSSHIRLECFGKKPTTIPDYKTIDRSLLRKILRDTELSVQEFNKLTKS